ncbi:MAG: hypothetical protein R3A80_03600 [Bdellovibrionota bacterium]
MSLKLKFLTLNSLSVLLLSASLSADEATDRVQEARKIYDDYISMRRDISSGAAAKSTVAFIKKYKLPSSDEDQRFIVNRVILPGTNPNLKLSFKEGVVDWNDNGNLYKVDLLSLRESKVRINGEEIDLNVFPAKSLSSAYNRAQGLVKRALFKKEISEMSWTKMLLYAAVLPFSTLTSCAQSTDGETAGFFTRAAEGLGGPIVKGVTGVGMAGGYIINRTVHTGRQIIGTDNRPYDSRSFWSGVKNAWNPSGQ